MSFIAGEELRHILHTNVNSYKPENIRGAAYELCLGDQVYLTDSATGKKDILEDKNSQVRIMPGQFALLLTEETITIPQNMIALMSIKFSAKIKGLVNISGFHVDPGFSGKIIFSVYNAGPTPIIMDKGKPYFLIWFCEVRGVVEAYNGNHNNQKEISAELIGKLQGEIASPNALLKQIKDLETTTNNKIKDASVISDYIKWLLTALVILFAGFTITLSYKNNQLREGYELGLSAKTVREEAQSLSIDTVFLEKIDSMIVNKLYSEKH